MKADDLYLPILQILSDRAPRHRRVLIEDLRKKLGMTAQESEYIDQGKSDMIGHVTHRLKRAGLIHREQAVSTITDKGIIFLKNHPHEINLSIIKKIKQYTEYTPKTRGVHNLALLFFFIIFMTACGAKTKQELIDNSKTRDSYVVNDNYQSVYKNVNEKVIECMGSSSQYVFRNIYSETKEADLFMHGLDSSGYAFLATIKGLEDGTTQVDVYSKVTFGTFPIIERVVKQGAYAQNGCPK